MTNLEKVIRENADVLATQEIMLEYIVNALCVDSDTYKHEYARNCDDCEFADVRLCNDRFRTWLMKEVKERYNEKR